MTETTQLVDEPSQHAGNRFPAGTSRRVRLAQALAFVALVAALVGATGPAEHLRTKYSWPPRTLPAGTPSRAWYTPLLLIRHVPESISARLPCSLPRVLPAATTPVTVLATARLPRANDGLVVTRVGDQLVVGIGDRTLTMVNLLEVPTGDGQCAYTLRIAADRWSIEGGPNEVAQDGALERMPIVSGLFSELDLRSGASPSIDVTTAVHAARTTVRQTIAWTVAALAIVAALLLAVVERRPRRPWAAATGLVHKAMRHARPADAVVAVVLLGWWVISPAFPDDGWIMAKQSMFSASRVFSPYYNIFGANAPLGNWLDWAQHWLTQSTSALIVLRVPALLCLAAVWVLCRWVLARVLASSAGEDRVALWALAGAFVAGALAWGMTLRPEPEVALLITGVMACTVRFLERETTAPLAVAAVLIPLALIAHPAGLISIAPPLAVAPRLFRWARARLPIGTTIVAAASALLIVLAFVGSDFQQRSADARLFGTYSSTESWGDEITRYENLSGLWYGTPLRRASVALMMLAVVAFLLRRQRSRRALLDLPSATLAVGLLLLIATPSKWPWHFGALLGIAGLAVAAETARLRDDSARSQGWQVRPLIVIGAAALAGAWAWGVRSSWSDLDLRTGDWTPGLEALFTLPQLAVVLPAILFIGMGLIELARGSEARLWRVPWRVALWTAPTLAVPLVAFTAAILVVDTVRTDSWTLARQNIETLRGDLGCGLADDLLVPAPDSMRPILTAGEPRPAPAWVPPTPIEGLSRFALGPARGGLARSPWFEFRAGQRSGFFLAGTPGASDRLELEWGHLRGGQIQSLGTDEVSRAFTYGVKSTLSWRFLAAGELPAPEPEANRIRVMLRTDVGPEAAVAVTPPVIYANEELARRLNHLESQSLVFPRLLTYFPCVQQPRLSAGIAEVPQYILVQSDARSPLRYATSPFAGLEDLYGLERLPLADSRYPPQRFVVFEVDERIPGAEIAPPAHVTVAP